MTPASVTREFYTYLIELHNSLGDILQPPLKVSSWLIEQQRNLVSCYMKWMLLCLAEPLEEILESKSACSLMCSAEGSKYMEKARKWTYRQGSMAWKIFSVPFQAQNHLCPFQTISKAQSPK